MQLRYLDNKKRIFPEANKIFSKYFKDKKEFKEFFENLNDIDKNKFLKISFF